jgi:hypothetical protein
MIRHCFTLAQQQKVTKSKYLKEQEYAYVKDNRVDDILHVANAEKIYDLSLRLSEKVKQLSIAGKSHDASAISSGEATERAVESHNFYALASVTTTHLCNKKKRNAELVVTKQTLAKSIMSIGTTNVPNESKGKNKDESNENEVESMNKGRKVTIEGMAKVLGETNNQMDSGNNEDDYEETRSRQRVRRKIPKVKKQMTRTNSSGKGAMRRQYPMARRQTTRLKGYTRG